MPLASQDNPSTSAQDSANAQHELELQSALLIDLDEPEALIATLSRLAQRRSSDLARISPTDSQRWRIVANALIEAEATINAAQSPEAHKLAQLNAQWPPSQLNDTPVIDARQHTQPTPLAEPPNQKHAD